MTSVLKPNTAVNGGECRKRHTFTYRNVTLSLFAIKNINQTFSGSSQAAETMFQCIYCQMTSPRQNVIISHVIGKHPGSELKIRRFHQKQVCPSLHFTV